MTDIQYITLCAFKKKAQPISKILYIKKEIYLEFFFSKMKIKKCI